MLRSSQVRPISCLKASVAKALMHLEHLEEQRLTMAIAQKSEAKAVLQQVASFEERQKSLALLKFRPLYRRRANPRNNRSHVQPAEVFLGFDVTNPGSIAN